MALSNSTASEETTSTSTSTTTTTAVPVTAPQRVVIEQPWIAFATGGDVTLHYPSSRVERTGFHQSNNEGARELDVLPSAIAPVTLDDRGRLTGDRTAADVVTDPEAEIRAPVSGTVKRGGRYVLYCKYSDNYLVIEPDDHPGWEVVVLHIGGVLVRRGEHVDVGETVIAPHAAQLPFESDVDAYRTVDPAWPHVHLEVVDPSIPNVPNPGSGC